MSFFSFLKGNGESSPEAQGCAQNERLQNLLITVAFLKRQGNETPTEMEIYKHLANRSCRMLPTVLKDLCAEAVQAGYLERLGETQFTYVISDEGLNYLGLPGR